MKAYCIACKFFQDGESDFAGGWCQNPALRLFDRVAGDYRPWVGPASSSPDLVNPGAKTLAKCDEIGGFEAT